MIVRPITAAESAKYDASVSHPLQSFAWGEFRSKTGLSVERIGTFDGEKLVSAFCVTFHPIPHTSYTVGYVPKCLMPDEMMFSALREIGDKYNALFIKLEPDISVPVSNTAQSAHASIDQFLIDHSCVSGRPLFTRFSFILSLLPTEEELLSQMHQKTRYNIGVASKKGVTVLEDTSDQGLADYLSLMHETTKRQQFYSHSDEYFRSMFAILLAAGMIHIFKAIYQNTVLSVWIVFTFAGTLYYPYGASSRRNRDVMANNLLAWEVIRFGKRIGCTKFDMWGSLGPTPSESDPWYGFHRFKEGFGGQLVEFVGSYDYVLHPKLYKIFRKLDDTRWSILRLKAKLGI